MVNKGRVALFFGTVVALCHAIWSILVAGGWAQGWMDWAMSKHFVTGTYVVGAFDFGGAVFLVAMAFVIGLIDGFILAALWNVIVGKHK